MACSFILLGGALATLHGTSGWVISRGDHSLDSIVYGLVTFLIGSAIAIVARIPFGRSCIYITGCVVSLRIALDPLALLLPWATMERVGQVEIRTGEMLSIYRVHAGAIGNDATIMRHENSLIIGWRVAILRHVRGDSFTFRRIDDHAFALDCTGSGIPSGTNTIIVELPK